MQLTLGGLKDEAYNGMVVDLIEDNKAKAGRLSVKLADGRKISVPYSGVDTTNLNLEICAICQEPCFPGYMCTTACNHVFHASCLIRWRSTSPYDIEAMGNRCPTCRAYTGGAKVLKWRELSAMELVCMALGSICQTYARQNNMREPSFDEEMRFVMNCFLQCRNNKQDNYEPLEAALVVARKRPYIENGLVDVLTQTLVVHVFYDETVDEKYREAIKAWIATIALPSLNA